jgi:mannitol-1-phosphate 5-dehydrogenase
MSVRNAKTFVGFGFGPIQAALFLYEAYKSGNFSRFVVAEVDPRMVQAIRDNAGTYRLNIAHKASTEHATITGVELYNPAVPEDRHKLISAIAESDEIATCLPSVAFFDAAGAAQASVARTLAEALARRTAPLPTIVYAAENHNHAAELLEQAVRQYAPPTALHSVQFLNTVIGKMSGVITDPQSIQRLSLVPITPDTKRAILVEDFNRILISRIVLPAYRRGIQVFIEKPDLLPFEEAKLYGHNAIHALIGYLAERRGLTTIAQAADHPDILHIAREAFLNESGAALIQRHAALHDDLFTPAGYRSYADDLLERMVRPNLNDLVARVCRDHLRKLSYDDRLYGTMRLALKYNIQPRNLALGAAAAIASLIKSGGGPDPHIAPLCNSATPLTDARVDQLLRTVWSDKTDEHADQLVSLTCNAIRRLHNL